MTDWRCYRKCPVCGATTGQPCRSLSGAIVDGRPDGTVTALAEPHGRRPLRSGGHTRCCRVCRTGCHKCRLEDRIAAEATRRYAHG